MLNAARPRKPQDLLLRSGAQVASHSRSSLQVEVRGTQLRQKERSAESNSLDIVLIEKFIP